MILQDRDIKPIYTTFEDLDLYKEARVFRVAIYQLAKRLPEQVSPARKADNNMSTAKLPMTNDQLPRRGFTLVELMLVVAIIGMLAAMVVPRLVGRTQQAKVSRSKSDLSAIGLALDLYELDLGVYPEQLQALVEAPSTTSSGQWNGPYLKKGLPKDPWGRDYHYKKESDHRQDYDIWSLGPDGQPGNDDVVNWE